MGTPADLILHRFGAAAGHAAPEPVDIIAIGGNRITFVGSADRLAELRGPATRLLDCRRGLVLPGFNDAHCHPLAMAVNKRHVDCSAPGVRCVADLLASLHAAAARGAPTAWVRGARLDVSRLHEGRPPTRAELDAAVPHRPVVLIDRAGQYCVLSSLALARCDHSLQLADPGAPDRADPATGLVPATDARLARAIPRLGDDELALGLRAANEDLLANGITSVQDTTWSNRPGHWQSWLAFRNRRLLSPRVTMLAGFESLDEFVRGGLRTGFGNTFQRIGALKIALDESSGREPAQADLDDIALRAHLAGFQLAFHVPDANLLRKALRTLDLIERRTGRPCRRPRLEHCPVCPPSLLAEMAARSAVVVSQPNLLREVAFDAPTGTDPELSRSLFPYLSLVAAGVEVAFSSDAPLTSCNPFQAIATALAHRPDDAAGPDCGTALTLGQALRMYSWSGAFCSNEEKFKGSLAPGQLADLVVVDLGGDRPGAANIEAATVATTILDGKIVWSRDGSDACTSAAPEFSAAR